MRKGHNNGSSVEYAIAYFHGRIEQQIETFADRISISPMELAARLATLLSGTGQRSSDNVPILSLATGAGNSTPPTLEGVEQSHSSETQTTRGSKTSKVAADKISKAAKARWANMSKAQKKKRLAKMLTGRNVKRTKNRTKTKKQIEQQRIYVARSVARKKGLPIPPLPNAA